MTPPCGYGFVIEQADVTWLGSLTSIGLMSSSAYLQDFAVWHTQRCANMSGACSIGHLLLAYTLLSHCRGSVKVMAF